MKLKEYFIMALFYTMESEKITSLCRKGKFTAVQLNKVSRFEGQPFWKNRFPLTKGMSSKHQFRTPSRV